ncbi:MAG: PDGLE domain-containing protein [Microcystaceae cyanobacterium]
MKKSILAILKTKFYLVALGSSLIIAFGLSSFASTTPDGLERVAKDLKFDHKATETNLPFPKLLADYKLQGVSPRLATPLAGLIGTLITFSLTWGLGSLMIKKSVNSSPNSSEEIS